MTARIVEIETWGLQVLDLVKQGRRVEDARVELKSVWPTPTEKAARQLAGHANAARGDKILWLIGVGEKDGVKGVDDVELSKPQEHSVK